jgi:DNA-binding transcriptional LysR family regulator
VAGFLLRYPKIMLDIEVSDHRNPPIEDYDVTLLITGEGFDGNVIARKIISSDVILVASPGYLARQGVPTHPDELASHNTLQLAHPDVPRQLLHLSSHNPNESAVDVAVTPALRVNYSDALMHAALHGAGITPAAPEVVARYLASGELVHVLPGWSAGRFTMYAAMPSRKFLPRRTEVFLDYLLEHTRELAAALRLNT